MTGITVTLLQLVRGGSSGPAWTGVEISNVLVAPVVEVDTIAAVVHEGHRAIYHLAIPKTDTHDWEGQLVQFFGCTWAVVGIPTKGIDDLIPGPWNTKVTVELYRTSAPDANALWRDTVQLLSDTITTDADGYQTATANTPVSTTAIFCEGVDAEQHTQDGKTGMRKTATAEVWTGAYSGETRLSYSGSTYAVTKAANTGRGTVLLNLEEVWR